MGFFFIPAVQDYTFENIWLFYVAMVMSFVFLIALVCCADVRRKSPVNIILLSGFTITEGFMLGAACSTYEADSVLMGILYILCT